MIRLTRLNGSPIALNSDLIKFVENSPDTVITLINGEKMIVREGTDEVIKLIVNFRRTVLSGLGTTGTDLNLMAAQNNLKAADELSRSQGGRRG